VTRRELIKDATLATLDRRAASTVTDAHNAITGHEPGLPVDQAKRGGRRFSLRGIAMMLNVLRFEDVSPAAAEALLCGPLCQVRYGAAVAISQRGDRDARLVMQRVLTDGNAPSRATVARHLNGFTWFAAEPLLRQALADQDSRVREAAVYAMCDLRNLDAYRLLSEILPHEVDAVRDAADYGLRDCQAPVIVAVLAAALLAKDPDVRVRALEALSANDSAQAIPVVRTALRDPDPEVSYAATLSFLELTKADGLAEIVALIKES